MEDTQNGYESPAADKLVPEALRQRILKQYAGAGCVALLTLACLFVLKGIGYMVGFLFAAYLVWMGVDIKLRWQKGDIICRRVICLKAHKAPLLKSRYVVVLKDQIAVDGENPVKTYYVPSSDKNAMQFSERMILDVFTEKRNPAELIAWQAVDVAKE